jgi:hypothetical protein
MEFHIRISWPLKMEPTGCAETSARIYQQTLRNFPEEGRSDLLRGGSQKTVSTSNRAHVFSGMIDINYENRRKEVGTLCGKILELNVAAGCTQICH